MGYHKQVAKMVFDIATTTELDSEVACMSKKMMKRKVKRGQLTFPIRSTCGLDGTSVYPVYDSKKDLKGSGRVPETWEGTNWSTIGHADYKGSKHYHGYTPNGIWNH